jgi:Xaa-Pro aminopeptidase
MTGAIPFDVDLLDDLLERARVDWLLATSRANTRYMLGGHQYFFQAEFDAIGISRYLPIVGYPRHSPAGAFAVVSPNERAQLRLEPVWVDRIVTAEISSVAAAAAASETMGKGARRIAVERAFLPIDAFDTLKSAFPEAEFVDATELLEELRMVKSETELDQLRRASEKIVAAMLAAFESVEAGSTKDEIARQFAAEVADRGLKFDYAWIAAGTSMDRTPVGGRWLPGEILSLDSGGQLNGYIGDLCRMAVMGEPTPEMVDRLGDVSAVQDVARNAIRAGVPGQEVIDAGQAALARSPYRQHMRTIAHGMGLVSHEGPRLTRTGVPYPPVHATRPLAAGMVLSVETYVADPSVGFVKLEDTVFVTETGFEAVGDSGRGWNVASGGGRSRSSLGIADALR